VADGALDDLRDAIAAERDAMVGLLADLVRIPSVSGSDAEREIQDVLAGHLDDAGLAVDLWPIDLAAVLAAPDAPGMEVDRHAAQGLVGRLPGGDGPTLLFNAHVDVVPPGDPGAWSRDPFSGAVVDGTLYGRGSCDMKAGLVAALWAVRAIRAIGVAPPGDVLLACVAGEEDGGLGTFALLERGWTADACVIPEPTGLDIVPANAGALTFRLRVPGQATHASRRLEGVSAIEKFVPVLEALAGLEARRNTDVDPLVGVWTLPYPLSIGTLSSGDWPSSVPDLLVAEGRIGVALDEPVAAARDALEAAVAEVCAADPWLSDHPVTVEWWGGQFASGRLPAGTGLVERVSSAHAEVTDGAVPSVWGAPYGSDLRLLVGKGGIPTVQYGPGDAAVAHGPDEHVRLDEVALVATVLGRLARGG
jgi:acetylornithine deacetylase